MSQVGLTFARRRVAGSYAVTDTEGVVRARIRSAGNGTRFTVHDAGGAILCTGSGGRWTPANRWRVTGAAGEPLLELRKHPLRPTAEVRLGAGRVLLVEGSWWRSGFRVREGDRAVVTAGAQVLADDTVDLAVVVAVVWIWRQLRRRDDEAAAVAASTVAIGGC